MRDYGFICRCLKSDVLFDGQELYIRTTNVFIIIWLGVDNSVTIFGVKLCFLSQNIFH